MATFTTTTDRFPASTTVYVYPASNWPTGSLPPSGSPLGSSTTSATVSSASVLTFTGLTAGTTYYMTADVGGTYRYVQFRVPADTGQVLTDQGYLAQSALAIPRYDGTFQQNGMWCVPNLGWSVSTNQPTAQLYRCVRFIPRRDMTIVKLGFVTTIAATNNDTVDVGLFDSTGAKIVTSGATSGKANATAGAQTVSISSTQLTAGTVYYAALQYGAVGGTAATFQTISGGAAGTPQMFGVTAGVLEAAVGTGSGGTLPTSLNFGTPSSAGFNIAVLES